MWTENNKADSSRTKCDDKHSSGGNVLGLPDQRMVILRHCIGQELDRRIQRLGRPYSDDGQDKDGPLKSREAKQRPRKALVHQSPARSRRLPTWGFPDPVASHAEHQVPSPSQVQD